MRRRLATLRWQLTLSHLGATAVTLVSMIAAIVLLSSAWIAFQNSPAREPAQDARIVARAVGNLVSGPDRAELAGVLRSIAAGELRVQVGPGPMAPEPAYRLDQFGASLRNLAYVVVLAPDGRVLASSAPEDAAFSPPERDEWAALARVALAGEHDLDDLVALRTGGGPVALGAAQIVGAGGAPVGVAIVAKSSLPRRIGSATPCAACSSSWRRRPACWSARSRSRWRRPVWWHTCCRGGWSGGWSGSGRPARRSRPATWRGGSRRGRATRSVSSRGASTGWPIGWP